MLGLGALTPLTPERPAAASATDSSRQPIEDPLTLSSVARARAEAAAHPRFGGLSVAAHQDSDLADMLAYDYAHIAQAPLYDVSHWDEEGFPRYSATGEPVTTKSEARYKQMSDSLLSASLALHNAETAKGTASADIFDKLVALVDRQPEELRTITMWNATAAEWDRVDSR
jgi:hypothetical protein